MLLRRDVLCAGSVALLAAAGPPRARATTMAPFGGKPFARAIRNTEASSGGRLGVAVLDIQDSRRFDWRGDERFPLASTFKVVLAAAVLAKVDSGRERLGRKVPIAASDMVAYAPVTEKQVGTPGMTVAALCEATIVWSDNPAANLLLPIVGGPSGLTTFARGIEDGQFRLDRTETALGEAAPGDPRDTTTPMAMLGSLDRLLLGSVLSPASRTQLTGWLVACRTGDQKIRAGLPDGWRCGDKTGGGGFGTNNDVAIIWPPGRRPILLASYLTETTAPLDTRNAALAVVARAAALAIG